MVINKDFREFIECLNKHKAEYLVVGGYAVAFHGHPRYTKNLDIWIRVSAENADKLLKAINDFGFSSLGLTKNDFETPELIIQLGNPPNRIDIITTASGIKFEDSYPHRIVENIEGLEVNFIDIENLKINKKATGRHQDLADIENLE